MAAGAAIYAKECAPCHGDRGLGDGPMAAQLQDKPAPLAAPEVARAATPLGWFEVITNGRMAKFMPPFSKKLDDQQRWQVTAYALTLGTNTAETQAGQAVYEANCTQCHGPTGGANALINFSDPAQMAKLALNDLTAVVAAGRGRMPAFQGQLSDAEILAASVYARSLALGAPLAASAPAATQAVAETTPSAASTPGTENTPVAGTTPGTESTPAAATTPGAALGKFSGEVQGGPGTVLPADLSVKLRGFEHESTSGTFNEASSQTGQVSNGAFTFQDVPIVTGRIYVAEVEYAGIPYQTEPLTAENGKAAFAFPPLTVYDTNQDLNQLTLEQVHYFFEAPANGQIAVSQVYVLTNSTDKAILVEMKGQDIPFITFPAGAQNINFQDAGMGGAFIGVKNGFIVPPSTEKYGIVAAFSLPYQNQLEYAQDFKLKVANISVIVPDGMKVEGPGFGAGQTASMGAQGGNFQSYNYVPTDQKLAFTLSGGSGSTGAPAQNSTTQTIIYILGGVGIVLILVGGWLFWRDRRKSAADEVDDEDDADSDQDEAPVEATDDLLDAIVALDDQFKAGKIPEAAYQQRRAELKAQLKARL